VIQQINWEVLHVAVIRHPTAEWLAQQILESVFGIEGRLDL
jgi:hypothetical protein